MSAAKTGSATKHGLPMTNQMSGPPLSSRPLTNGANMGLLDGKRPIQPPITHVFKS